MLKKCKPPTHPHLGCEGVLPRTLGAEKPGVRGVMVIFSGTAKGDPCGVMVRRCGVAAVGVAAMEALHQAQGTRRKKERGEEVRCGDIYRDKYCK